MYVNVILNHGRITRGYKDMLSFKGRIKSSLVIQILFLQRTWTKSAIVEQKL